MRENRQDEAYFSYENLDVWKKAIEFANEVIGLVDTLRTDRKHYRLIEQFESSGTSVAMNIPERKGRYSKKEFVQFLYITRGSLFETITLIEIFKRRQWVGLAQYQMIRNMGNEIRKMLSRLIRSIKNPINLNHKL